MSVQPGTCNCKEVAKNVSPGGALDASETAAKRGGIAESTFRGAACTFSSYEARYRYLRGVAACTPGVTFPCCTSTTQACGCGSEEPN